MHPNNVPTVTVATLRELDPEIVLLDVREDDEWAAGHIAQARHIPMSQIPEAVATAQLSPESPIVVVCAVGGRSAHATAWLNDQGFDATNLYGGMHAWAQAGNEMVSETGAPARVL